MTRRDILLPAFPTYSDYPLRVLLACDFDANPYVSELCESLNDVGVTVEAGLRPFWIPQKEYDVVHLQWPEALFRWRSPSWAEIRLLLNDVLPSWRSRSRIVITRHNKAAHDRTNPFWQSLYDNVYEYADAVVHLGPFGLEQFRATVGSNVRFHKVIPHPVYDAYGEPMESCSAKKTLSVPQGTPAMLAFGGIRTEDERRLLLNAFSRVSTSKKILLAPNFGSPLRPSRRMLFKWLKWELKNRELVWPRRLRLGSAPVKDSDVKFYFSAADVVLIPRIDTLNSGILPLAFQFGRVVVGTDVGNLGITLRSTGNPVFCPNSPDSFARAIEEGLRLAEAGLGAQNASYASEHWSLRESSRMHKGFYESILNYTSPEANRFSHGERMG